MEHRFITPNDGFVRAIAICRQRLLDCSAEAVIGSLMERGVKQNGSVEAGVTQVNRCFFKKSPYIHNIRTASSFLYIINLNSLQAPHVRPQMPPEVARWLESNEISSALLRQSPAVTTNC